MTAKLPDETWRNFVARKGAENGVSEECLIVFDELCEDDFFPEREAAVAALEEWDVLGFDVTEERGLPLFALVSGLLVVALIVVAVFAFRNDGWSAW